MTTDIQSQRAKAFDHLFDSVVATDSQGIITDWNSASETLFGYTGDQIIGQHESILLVPEDSGRITAEIKSAIDQRGKWSGEIRIQHNAGYIRWIESNCVALYNDDDDMTGSLKINRDITDRKQESERINQVQHYDQLTGIPNRHLLLARLSHLILQSERNLRSFALLYIDLDNFKMINEDKGHAFGDLVLVECAYRLKETVRESDTVARVGGDEFLLVLEEIPDKHLVSDMARKINNTLNGTLIIDDEKVELSCSIGIAIFPDDGTSTDDLLLVTDKAMSIAKNK